MALEQADPERAEQRPTEQERELEWWRDHSKMQEQQVGQEWTEAGDARVLEHCRPAAAPPSAEDRTLIARQETLRGELPVDLYPDCPQA